MHIESKSGDSRVEIMDDNHQKIDDYIFSVKLFSVSLFCRLQKKTNDSSPVVFQK